MNIIETSETWNGFPKNVVFLRLPLVPKPTNIFSQKKKISKLVATMVTSENYAINEIVVTVLWTITLQATNNEINILFLSLNIQ